MTTLTVRKRVSLFYQQGSSDKEYNIFIEDSASVPGMYDVRATWGRRGSPNDTQHKAQGVTMNEAEATFFSLKRAKEGKGYRADTSLGFTAPATEVIEKLVSAPPVMSAPEREYTELKPQLLNPIDVDEMEAYITSDDWLVQEKLDGKRIMVEVSFGKVTASNRRSWKVGIPQDVADELSKFEDCILDGELVGGVYYVFDCLGHNGEDLRSDSYMNRFNRLVESVIGDRMLYQVDIVPTAYSMDDKRALIASLQHNEGVVFKELSAAYSVGRPNKLGSQLKCKFWSSATCVVSAVNTKRSVAVSVDSPDGFVPVGNVTVPPNHELPNVGDYVEVKYLYAHKEGSLYQPQYLGTRDDVEIDIHSSLKFKAEDEDSDY
jgi:bifunctional non-homologous end joining protein LigD